MHLTGCGLRTGALTLFACLCFAVDFTPLAAQTVAQSRNARAVAPDDPSYAVRFRGYQLLRNRKYEAAVQQFREALKLDPRRAELHRQIAYTLLKMGENEAAIEAFEAYERARPGEPQNGIELAYLYYQARREQEAIELFRRVSSSSDLRLATQAREACKRIEERMLAEIARWKASVEIDPDNDGNRELLAEAYARHNEPVRAIEQYLANRKLKPARYSDLLRLAQLYEQTGAKETAGCYYLIASRMPDARIAEMARSGLGNGTLEPWDFERALKLEPGQQQLRRELAYLYIAARQRGAAVAHLEKVLEREPDDFQSLAQLGYLYSDTGRKAEARRIFARLRDEAPADVAQKAKAALETLPLPADGAHGSAETFATEAYTLLSRKRYDEAVARFRRALESDPSRINLYREIGFACLKMGEPEQALEAFENYGRVRPGDAGNTLQLAYIYMQTGREAKGLECFKRVEQAGDQERAAQAREARTVAERPMLAEIARWSDAVEHDPNDVDNREMLAEALARHGDLSAAIAQYRELRRGAPARYRYLLALAKLYEQGKQSGLAKAYALLASRCPDGRIAESGRQMAGNRYPDVNDFETAIAQEPGQTEVRRELGYLYLAMKQAANAARQFEAVVAAEPNDYQSLTQLGFIYADLGRRRDSVTILARAKKEAPVELARKAHAALRDLGELSGGDAAGPAGQVGAAVEQHRQLAYASLKRDYLQAAAREFEEVYKLNPSDFDAIMQLGWLYNVMKRDDVAIRWFKLASKSPNRKTAAEARRAVTNLSWPLRRVISTLWVQPVISSRWTDVFGYGQLKTEYRIPHLPFRPYIGMRFVGDSRTRTGGERPQIFSEDGVIASVGVVGPIYKSLLGWAEAGNQVSFLNSRPVGLQRSEPDYRGGLSYGRVWGPKLFNREPGRFFELTSDAVYLSRYGQNGVFYNQTKSGYQLPPFKGFYHQPFMAANFVADVRGDFYTNFAEFGPGYRFGFIKFSRMNAYVALIRGAYTTQGRRAVNYIRGPNYWDLRLVIWYAKSF